MKTIKSLIRVTGLLVAIFSSQSYASFIANVNGSGVLTDVLNLDVNGTLYDVRFENGSCNSLFSNCSDFGPLLDDLALAGEIASALLNQVFVDGLSGNGVDMSPFNSLQSNTLGCTNSSSCLVLLPTKLGGTDSFGRPITLEGGYIINRQSGFTDTLGTGNILSSNTNVQATANFSTTLRDNLTYGIVSLSSTSTPSTSIPEPGALGLFALGWLGVMRLRKRFQ